MTAILDLTQKNIPAVTDCLAIQTSPSTSDAKKATVADCNSQPVQSFATLAALNAAVPSPVVGQKYYVTAIKTRVMWNGSYWVTDESSKKIVHYRPSITAGGGTVTHTIAHTLGRTPTFIRIQAACKCYSVSMAATSDGTWDNPSYDWTTTGVCYLLSTDYTGSVYDSSLLTDYIIGLGAGSGDAMFFKLTSVSNTNIVLEYQGGIAHDFDVEMKIELC